MFPLVSTVGGSIFWLANYFHLENYSFVLKYVVTKTEYSGARPIEQGKDLFL